MAKYRKKPLVIEAEQFFPDKEPWPEGVKRRVADVYDVTEDCHYKGKREQFYVETLEGDFEAKEGDWIITGVKGEKYPCKPDIFGATYDEVGGE